MGRTSTTKMTAHDKRNIAVVLALLALAAGCKHPPKQTTTVPPAPVRNETPPAPGAPAIGLFSAEPTSIEKGQPSNLRWSVTNATNVSIDGGVGPVSPSGRRAVYPDSTTTFTLTATGPGGTQTASATITVVTPPQPPGPETRSKPTFAEIAARLQDLHFDYDKSDVRAQDQALLSGDASALKTIFATFPNSSITIEGHCDERGSAEYNLALGDRRASATKDALVALGVQGDRLKTVSYGKERPICTEENEVCFQQNRRAHFNAAQ
jgi:peptidoglycan-associated lipoprotein